MKKNHFLFLALFCTLLCSPALHAAEKLVSGASTWKYLHDGSDQGSAWKEEVFDDSSWDETAIINNETGFHETTVYLRHQFTVANPGDIKNLLLRFFRDDGAVVYINGNEVYRTNMPMGTISFSTTATTEVTVNDIYRAAGDLLPVSVLQSGTNTIAVEIHQFSAVSSDLTFAMDLLVNPVYTPEAFNRGPYLQMITPTSAIVRWDTADATSNNRVSFGLAPESLVTVVPANADAHFHEALLTGLTPATIYYYRVDSDDPDLFSGGPDHFFKTAPLPGSTTPVRLWVIGDSGTGDENQQNVYSAYQQYTASTYTDVWLMLGDNAYMNGTDAEYQARFFYIYPSLLRQTGVWPALGNHDGYGVNTTFEEGPYYHAFSLPTNAEAGGVASGTEAYYSYDHGNIHFVALDSFDMDRSVTAGMAQWLEDDLSNTTADWIIAYWHHPPYSNGSHNSDSGDWYDDSSTPFNSYGAMQEMRSNILPILEQYGVDLVLTGHSHGYERSKFIKEHYDVSSTYSDISHALNTGSGDNHTGMTAYSKDHPAIPHGGTVYAVAGTAGGAYGVNPFPMMYLSLAELGSMVIDVHNLALSARFINDSGVVRDAFTIQKLRNDLDPDRDGDGIANESDNCPLNANADQLNVDLDAFGNLCDSDWLDNDLDSIGNDSDWDDDGDGIPDVVDANPLNGANTQEISLPLDSLYRGVKNSKRLSP